MPLEKPSRFIRPASVHFDMLEPGLARPMRCVRLPPRSSTYKEASLMPLPVLDSCNNQGKKFPAIAHDARPLESRHSDQHCSQRARVSDEQLHVLFMDHAPTKLQKHLDGWKLWSKFCNFSPAIPSLPPLLDFLKSLAFGVNCHRGSNRKRSAKGVLSAMMFAGAKLLLNTLQGLLECSLVTDTWSCHEQKKLCICLCLQRAR